MQTLAIRPRSFHASGRSARAASFVTPAMRVTPAVLVALVALVAPAPAAAQLTLAHDTLARDTPTALTCGFCADEAIGVVFREIGTGTAGLRPGHFPVTLQSVQIALADATVTAAGCMTQMTGGVVSAIVEIWAGVTVPTTTPPSTAALGEPWATDETLVWASDAVPITLSTPTAVGGTAFDLQLNSFMLQNTDGSPVVVAAPNAYLRVVVTLPGGGTSSLCTGGTEGPGGFPLRDNDGVIAPNRSFIYATGAGWFWNEAVPGGAINGDWGVRLIVQPMGTGGTDGGPRDAGPPGDSGASDAGAGLDGGPSVDAGTVTPPPASSGCSCRIVARPSVGAGVYACALAVGLVVRAPGRRRRAP